MKELRIAIALIWRDGHILVARRRDDADHLAGYWEFPGGKCRLDESLEECLKREVWEEIGITVGTIAERPSITHDYPERRVRLHPFDCRILSGEPRPLQCAALRWLAPQELSSLKFPPANASLIEQILEA